MRVHNMSGKEACRLKWLGHSMVEAIMIKLIELNIWMPTNVQVKNNNNISLTGPHYGQFSCARGHIYT